MNWASLGSKLDAVSTQNKALAAALTTLQGSVDGINAKLDAIAACGAQKKFWTGSGCVADSTSSGKVETASFRYDMSFNRTARKYDSSAPTNSFCQSNGFDAITSLTPMMGTYHTGGREGEDSSYIMYYNVTCMRIAH